MLSCIETQLALTVIGPAGQHLRLQRNNPVFQAGRDILNKPLPAEQAWQQLQELVANPLKALVTWCERYGLTFKDKGDTLRLNDVELDRQHWLPLLTRTHAVGASPKHLLSFAVLLSSMAKTAPVGKITLHLREGAQSDLPPFLLTKMLLPAEARRGDAVTETSTGDTPYLVSVTGFALTPSGFQLQSGRVLCQIHDEQEADDILAQPVILGFNRTYRCEEGTADGWLEDMSFDSLKAARLNAQEIQKSGSEARIINRITGETVSLR